MNHHATKSASTGPLLPMDYAALGYLAECGGSAPAIAIPLRLFRGPFDKDAPNLVDLGLVKHRRGGITSITAAGRKALAEHQTKETV